MAKMTITLCYVMLVFNSNAQNSDEWFGQKETQKKYLAEQIAALKVYGSYLQKGYDIARDGLNTIGHIKKGDLDLHAGYFHSLTAVNPAIKQYPRVKDIINIQEQINKIMDRSKKQTAQDNLLTIAEKQYVNRVYARLQDDCKSIVEELASVTSPESGYQMKDDERIKRIDKLYADTQSQWKFVQSFSNEVWTLSMSRSMEQNEINNSRSLYGIKK